MVTESRKQFWQLICRGKPPGKRWFLYLLGILIPLILIMVPALPAYAIDLPDGTPRVDDIWCFRNVLETGDFLIIIYENTPYSTPPLTPYDVAFVWRLFDTDGTTEIDQATGYPYHEKGYNYNVVSWYFSASEAPAWGENYYIRLSGLPMAFDDPVTYNFQISGEDYSELTSPQADILESLSILVIDLAEELNLEWNLDTGEKLTTSGETGTVLSVEGESFFRGAIYGAMRIAPYAFSYHIGDINNTWRNWDNAYSVNLSTQFEGSYLGEAMDAGNEMLGVDYNLFGLLGLLIGCAVLFGACIIVGGDVWGTAIFCTGIVVIGSRITLVDLTVVALAAAICWIFISAKVWKLF